jgi:hypothetical protein
MVALTVLALAQPRLGLPLAAAEPEGPLRAGVAKTDITPVRPVRLAGYESRKDLSQGVHDPLSARAVAFEQGGRRLVLVSTDIIGFYDGTAEPIRKAILETCDLQPSELFLAAIHTHSAPGLTVNSERGHSNNVEYTSVLCTRLSDLVRGALARLAPVRIGFGSGASPVGANRREIEFDAAGNPKVRLGRNPSVLTDREVQVVKLVPADTEAPLALLFDYATHSTSMGPQNYLVSGDVHGLAEQFVEQYLGRGVIAPAFAGASGDIDPWYRVRPEFKTTNGWIPEPVLLGTMLGEEVVTVADAVHQYQASGAINTRFATLELPAKPKGQTVSTNGLPPALLNLSVGRVGDIAFVGLGGEVFSEVGRAIKAASPFAHTVVLTHCNGAAGYLPVQRAYLEGGYEVQSSPFASTAADLVVKEALRLLHQL